MFDVGFSELVLIMVIALLVLGPERLPVVARNIGRWVGKARSMLRTVKAEMKQEMAAEELQRALKKQAGSTDPFEILEKSAAPASKPDPGQPASPPESAPSSSDTHDRS